MLSNFVWWSHRNFQGQYSGLDTPEDCANTQHFKNYPSPVSYCHNSRGYRDQEWPQSLQELNQAVWCFGDSFTVGYGCPHSHAWPFLLQQQLNQRCINVSMNGGSNEWIARKIHELANECVPSTVVVHWTYTHRRELSEFNLPKIANQHWKIFYNNIRDPQWPTVDLDQFHTLPEFIKNEILDLHYNPTVEKFSFDCISPQIYDDDRIAHYSENATSVDDSNNLLCCIDSVEQLAQSRGINLIHSFIPRFATPKESARIMEKMKESNVKFIPELIQIDLARDGLHYDIKTAQSLVQQIIELM
jgi:hypothetical protein